MTEGTKDEAGARQHWLGLINATTWFIYGEDKRTFRRASEIAQHRYNPVFAFNKARAQYITENPMQRRF